MGSITVQSCIAKIREQLFDDDSGNYRYSNDELVAWINTAQRTICLLKPGANIITGAYQLVSGAKQTLGDADLSLIDVIRNMGANGNTPGLPIRLISRTALAILLPDWQSQPASASTKYYMYDQTGDPKVFYVYPPQPGSQCGYVELVKAALPDDALYVGTITLDDEYEMPIVDYATFRGYLREDPAKAAAYYQTFHQAITGTQAREEDLARATQGGAP